MGSGVNRHFISVDGGTLHLCDLSRTLLAASVPVCQVRSRQPRPHQPWGRVTYRVPAAGRASRAEGPARQQSQHCGVRGCSQATPGGHHCRSLSGTPARTREA